MLLTRVGVLRGGPSEEFDVSLATGKAVLDNLPSEQYRPIDIFIDKKGEWHRGGIPVSPQRAIQDVDVVFNALHGHFGEDGKVQQLLAKFAIPYTGSEVLTSAIGMNKVLAKKFMVQNGIQTAPYKLVEISPTLPDQLYEIFRTSPQPSVIKPYNGGSSLGVSIARTYEELCSGVAQAFSFAPKVMIEEYIPGREGTLGVISEFRNQNIYPLLPIEIRPTGGKTFFDYEAKYGGFSEEICPGNFSKEEMKEIERVVLATHSAMHLRHYSRTDFIINPNRGIFILEVNSLPGLTAESLFPKALQTLGIKLSEFLSHVVTLAQRRK